MQDDYILPGQRQYMLLSSPWEAESVDKPTWQRPTNKGGTAAKRDNESPFAQRSMCLSLAVGKESETGWSVARKVEQRSRNVWATFQLHNICDPRGKLWCSLNTAAPSLRKWSRLSASWICRECLEAFLDANLCAANQCAGAGQPLIYFRWSHCVVV